MKTWQRWLLIAVVALGAGLWLWTRDEALDPRALAWLEEVAAPGESTAYHQLLGLDAPAGQDTAAAGRQILEAHRQWRAQHRYHEPMVVEAERARIALPGKSLCALAEGDCLQRLRADRAGLDALLARHAELLERYQRLLALDDYHTLGLPSADEPLANFSSLDQANRLLAARALALADAGRGDEAQALLQQDVARLRAWLAQADTLILKMLLGRLLGRDLDSLAVLAREGLIARPEQQPALSEAERSLHMPMRREFALLGNGFLHMMDDPQIAAELGGGAWQLSLLYKPHMTINDSLPAYLHVAEDSRLDPRAFAELVPRGEQPQPGLWRRARNPIGVVLGGIAMPNFHVYLARMHDLDAKLALFASLGQAVPEADNPYYPGHKANWDPERQAYCFAGPLADERGLRCLPWTAPPAR